MLFASILDELNNNTKTSKNNEILETIRNGNKTMFLHITENTEKTMKILEEHNENCKHLKYLMVRQEGMWESIRYIRNETKRKQCFMYTLLILMVIFQYFLYLSYMLLKESRNKQIDCIINYN
tara:strand:+ start:50 stop:418 length:369 start_codon:yes stop_codon:yes gene_type:complete